MITKSITYPSAKEKTVSWGILWTPDANIPIKGMLQLCHGMCEYIERYTSVAQWFCDQGYAVCGNDHLGHKNTAIKNDQPLGNFGNLNSYPNLVDDVDGLRKALRGEFPDIPWILLGHSMGSFIARLYAIKYHQNIDGLIISGTAQSNPLLAVGKCLSGSIAKIRGCEYISKLVDNMVSSRFNAGIKNPVTPSDWVCSDPLVAKSHATDPFCAFTFSTSAYHDLFAMNMEVNNNQWFFKFPKDLPVFFFAGEEDPVGDFGKGPRHVAENLKMSGVTHVDITMYPNARHEMLNEVNNLEVFEDIKNWMETIPVKAPSTN